MSEVKRGGGRPRRVCHHEAGHLLARWYCGHRTRRAVVLTFERIRALKRGAAPNGGTFVYYGFVEGDDIYCDPSEAMRVVDGKLRKTKISRRPSVDREMELINLYAGARAEALFRHRSINAVMVDGGHCDMGSAAILLDAWPSSSLERWKVGRDADARARVLVRSPCGALAIKAMVDVLAEHGEIDGRKVDSLCRRAYGGRQCTFGAWYDLWPPTLAQIRAGYLPNRGPRAAA